MSKNAKKLVPELRFPEFRGMGEWEIKRLNQVCEVNPAAKKLPESFIYIDLESVEAGALLKKNLIKLEGAPSRAQRLLIAGDVIFQMVRPYQKNNFFFQCEDGFEYVASTGYAQLRAHESNTYLYQYIHTDRFVDRVLAKCTGSNYPAINSSDLAEIKFELPQPAEQQKIADCLSSIDDLITAQSQKVEALKTHKKGLMQQLFPREGETVPRLRFPEFQGDWLLVPLGQCFNNIGGTALEKYVTEGARHHFISIGNYSPEGKYIDKGQRVEINELTKTKLLNKNNLVMVLNDKTLAGDIIGSTLLIDEDDKYIYNQRSERLIVGNYFSPVFAWHLLNSEIFRKQVFKLSQGGTQIYVNFPAIKTIELCFPKNPNEQQKIADCLTSIDDLISAQVQKLDTLKTHKKGLMQQLFPSMETENQWAEFVPIRT